VRRGVAPRAAAVLTTAVLVTACLGPRRDTSSFYLLSPTPAASAGTPVPVSIGLGPVTLPGYLDRTQMVTRLGVNQIALAESDRWAEPLADNVVGTVRENLAALLPQSTYVAYPWYASDAPDFAVALDVRRFESDAAGAVVLEATWRLTRGATDLGSHDVRIQEQADGPGRVAAVAAQSRALGELSGQIGATIRRTAGR
jgi:uncharacterized protein